MLRSLLLASVTLALAAQTPAPVEAPKTPQAPAPAPAPAEAPKAPQAPAAKPVQAAPRPAQVTPAPRPMPVPPMKMAPPPVDPKEAEKVLGWLGKTPIKQWEFDLFLNISLPEQQRRQVMMMPGAKDQYLKRFLEYKVLAAKAAKEGLGSKAEYRKKMKLMRMQVLIQSLFDRDGELLKERTTVKDEDVKAYFDKHPEKFTTPESFSARHILISTKAQGQEKARTDEEAQARVKLAQEALAAGKPFEEVAREFSDDPGSKEKGGLYENITFGRFVPEFEKAVREQEAGKVGGPVKTMHGYHLIKVEKITPATPQTFEAAKEAARQQAMAERQETVMTTYMDEARKMTNFREEPSAKPAVPAAPPKMPAQAPAATPAAPKAAKGTK